ncbi:MAG: chloride channel protein, partial [Acidobacteriota bacterium]
VGLFSTYVTRLVYWIEDQFEKLPVHWMWWPAIGAIAVGVLGIWAPRTLGVGYDNIENALAGNFAAHALLVLVFAKFVSWSIALGSGTSGGTLAPLLTFGAGLGWLTCHQIAEWAPAWHVDPRVGALVGMTAMFAGAARALMASIAFALESTQQIHCVVPIVAGVTVAYFASCLMMRTTIMTEKLVRRGVRVAGEYDVDPLSHVLVGEIATRELRTLDADMKIATALETLDRHQAYPVLRLDKLVGIVTTRELMKAVPEERVADIISRPPVVARPSETARAAIERMAKEDVGRLILVDETDPGKAIGIATRSDFIAAFARSRKSDAIPEGIE